MTRTRTIHKPPPELLRRVRAADLALNQLRRQSIEPSMAERIWLVAGAVVALVCVMVLL